MKPTIGVVGLGIMGGAMAEALRADAYKVVGYDVRADARQRLQNAGGRPLRSSTAVAASADVLITSLATVAALAQGLSQHDTASVCEVLGRMAGVGRLRDNAKSATGGRKQ